MRHTRTSVCTAEAGRMTEAEAEAIMWLGTMLVGWIIFNTIGKPDDDH